MLRPPSAVNCEAALYDHRCATLLFWSCATTPGDNTASSVTTCEEVGISMISCWVMTVPRGGRGGIHQRGVAHHFHRLAGGAELQLGVELLVIGGLQGDAAACFTFKARRRDGELIRPGIQEFDNPGALLIGLGIAFDVGVFINHLDRRIRHQAALRIQNAAAHGRAHFLGFQHGKREK